MRQAIAGAGIEPAEVGYVNAHGTGTLLIDAIEAGAIARVFGRHPLVSSTKAATGHLLGACGVTEAAFCVAAIERGIQKKLRLGNLDARRDWGHARDYVEGMWRILQQDEPDDFVLATGETHTVREFVEKAFAVVDRRIEWTGRGVDEKGIDARSGEELIEIDPRYFRPNEVDFLLGDATKARTRLGWTHRVPFEALVSEMVEADLRAVMREVGRNDFEGY